MIQKNMVLVGAHLSAVLSLAGHMYQDGHCVQILLALPVVG